MCRLQYCLAKQHTVLRGNCTTSILQQLIAEFFLEQLQQREVTTEIMKDPVVTHDGEVYERIRCQQ